jgi:hypothetical protein
MIPTIQVTHVIYQQLFKLTRLGEETDRENQTVVISCYKTIEQKQQSLLAFYLFAAPLIKHN